MLNNIYGTVLIIKTLAEIACWGMMFLCLKCGYTTLKDISNEQTVKTAEAVRKYQEYKEKQR